MDSRSRSKRYNNYSKKTTKTVKKVRKKRRIKFKALFIFLLVLCFLGIIVMGLLSRPITNIYISGNKILSDQEIIDIARLSNYPSTFNNPSILIKRRLKNNNLIYNASVKKKLFTKVYIEVIENTPLFYDSSSNKTVLFDKTMVDDNFDCAILINYVPDTIYDKFITKMSELNDEVLERISEIKYDPNDVDDERFLFMMDDGNYVYLTLSKLSSVNNYVSIIKNFESKKGILFLDSGEYFQILEN